jgi:5-methylcytosine-specific restriction endonuclease McrA
MTRRVKESRWAFAQRKSCSDACARALKVPKGPRGPYKTNHQSAKTVRACQHCGKVFAAYPSNVGKFCSRACYHSSRERLITCERCGKQFKRNDSTKRPTRFCSNVCKRTGWNAPRSCAQCGTIFTPTNMRGQRYCSKVCGLIGHHAQDLAEGKRPPHVELTCQHCGKVFSVFPSAANREDRDLPIYCSKPCKHAGQTKSEEHKRQRKTAGAARRRALKLSTGPFEIIDARVIVERDGAVCHLCGQPIDLALHGWNPMGLTLDHVIPLARGGPHTIDNLKPAHRVCNTSKGARVI